MEDKTEIISGNDGLSGFGEDPLAMPETAPVAEEAKPPKKAIKVPAGALVLLLLLLLGGGGFFAYKKFLPSMKYKKAVAAYQKKDFPSVITLLEPVKKAVAGKENVNLMLGISYLLGKDFDKAIPELTEADKKLSSVETLTALGETYLGKKDSKKALEYFSAAYKKAPEDGLLAKIAELAYGSANYTLAIESYKKLKDKNKITPQGLSNLGVSFYETGDTDKSYENLIGAFMQNHSSPALDKYLGMVFYIRQEYRKSEEFLSRHFGKNPQDPDSAIRLTDIYYTAKDLKKAEEICRTGISKQNSKSAILKYYLSCISLRGKKQKDALAFLKDAIAEKAYLKKLAKIDGDFAALSKNPEFLKIIN